MISETSSIDLLRGLMLLVLFCSLDYSQKSTAPLRI
jgi:hypothetical protein